MFRHAVVTSATLVSLLACVPPPSEGEGEGEDVGGRFPSLLPAGFALQDLGEIEVVDGETPDLSYDADLDVRAFFIVAVSNDNRHFVVPISVRAPDGQEVVQPEGDGDSSKDAYFAGFSGPSGVSANRVTGRPRAVAGMFPNTPRLAMQSGTWTFRVGLYELANDDDGAPANVPLNGPLRVGIVERRVDPPETGRIDIVMSVHASSGLDAASAATDPTIQAALGLVDEAFDGVGVRVGTVSYLDLDASIAQPLDLEGPSCLGGDVASVFDQVTPVNDAIHLVLINSFTCLRLGGAIDVGANIAAISNGVPGIPFATRDGIIVATALKDDFPEDWSLVVAHEIGHFLGLLHTKEPIDVFDNIEDTNDASPDDYLMFFNVSQGQSALITPDQGRVLRVHPLVLEP